MKIKKTNNDSTKPNSANTEYSANTELKHKELKTLHFIKELKNKQNSVDISDQYYRYRKEYRQAITSKKQESFDNYIYSTKNRLKAIWKVIKQNPSSEDKEQVTIDNDVLNQYSTSIGRQLEQSINLLKLRRQN